MFDNIGGKIKGLAKLICWAGIVVSAILGILIWANHGNFLTGLLYIVVGGLASWIGSFCTYGFGQLIEDTAAIRYQLMKRAVETIQNGVQRTAPVQNETEKKKILREEGWQCKCGYVNREYASSCASCGAKKWEV